MIQNSLERDTLVEQVAEVIDRHGLRLPALLVLQMGHPLTFLGGQLLWIAQPMLSLLLSGNMIRQAARLLEEPQMVNALIARLEAKEV